MKTLLYTLMIMITASCATTDLRYRADELDWKDRIPNANASIVHSVYLIGDVGGAEPDTTTIPLIELKKALYNDDRDDDKTDIVFLGDNIYPVGMPPLDHDDRADAEHRLNVQLEAVRGFKGNITFVPGNHDWYTYGREGLKRQERYIEEYLSQYGETFTDYFRPSDGCGDIAVMEISPKISMISIDSHWFLAEKDKEGYDYSDCDIQTRKEFVEAFADTMSRLSNHQILLTMHHPIYTTGKHGGYYNWMAYMFPVTEYKRQIRIPAPVSGSIVAYMRPRVSEQDTKHAEYTNYRNYLIPPIQQHGNTIVAAGHEHTLQYHVRDGIDYIVSGSGSKKEPVGTAWYTRFAYGDYGYGLVDYYSDGTVWLTFYASVDDDQDFVEVYRSQLNL